MSQAQGLDIKEGEQAVVFEEFERGDIACRDFLSFFFLSLFFSLSYIHALLFKVGVGVLFTLDDFAEDASGCHGVGCENGFLVDSGRHGGNLGHGGSYEIEYFSIIGIKVWDLWKVKYGVDG